MAKYLYTPHAIGEEFTARNFGLMDGDSVYFGHYPVDVTPALLIKLKENAVFADLLEKGAFSITEDVEAGVAVVEAIADVTVPATI
jgi:hypothetical protein